MSRLKLGSNCLRDITFRSSPFTLWRHEEEDVGPVSSSSDDPDYRNLAVNRLRPGELQWALNHDAVHGIAYAFKNPVAVADPIDDPEDDRKTYLIRVRRDDLAKALGKINEWIIENPGPAGMQAFGFVRALSREGLTERATGDDELR
jgi:hypothetical protein